MKVTIGLAEAKAKLSELVERAESGETIVISRNGRPVAEMRPIKTISPSDAAARIRAIRARVAKRNVGKKAWPKGSIRDVAHRDHRF